VDTASDAYIAALPKDLIASAVQAANQLSTFEGKKVRAPLLDLPYKILTKALGSVKSVRRLARDTFGAGIQNLFSTRGKPFVVKDLVSAKYPLFAHLNIKYKRGGGPHSVIPGSDYKNGDGPFAYLHPRLMRSVLYLGISDPSVVTRELELWTQLERKINALLPSGSVDGLEGLVSSLMDGIRGSSYDDQVRIVNLRLMALGGDPGRAISVAQFIITNLDAILTAADLVGVSYINPIGTLFATTPEDFSRYCDTSKIFSDVPILKEYIGMLRVVAFGTLVRNAMLGRDGERVVSFSFKRDTPFRNGEALAATLISGALQRAQLRNLSDQHVHHHDLDLYGQD
jgi:hypothetical protein